MIERQKLVDENNQQLQQAIDVIEKLTDELYLNNKSPHFKSSAGKHIRHILDFYDCFLGGWQEKIDYDDRKRDRRFEYDRQYGIQKIRETMDALNDLPAVADKSDYRLRVKNDEASHGSNQSPFSFSTIERELQFLKFHAVHHFAIIAMILQIQGFKLPQDFGFAVSTLQYIKQLATENHNDH